MHGREPYKSQLRATIGWHPTDEVGRMTYGRYAAHDLLSVSGPSIVTPRLMTLDWKLTVLPKRLMESILTLFSCCWPPNHVNCVFSEFNFSLFDDIRISISAIHAFTLDTRDSAFQKHRELRSFNVFKKFKINENCGNKQCGCMCLVWL